MYKLCKSWKFKYKTFRLITRSITLIYLFIFSLIVFEAINHELPSHKLNLLYLIFICICSDVGGFVFGKTLKGKKLTRISPNKTIEGLLGGVGFVLIFLSGIYFYNLISLDLVLASLISLPFAFIGDYFESQLKREQFIKDSGSLIPGHGGVWDRLDSHIAVLPIFIFLTSLMT